MLSSFTAWLLDALSWFGDLIIKLLIELINLIIVAIATCLTLIISLFPNVDGIPFEIPNSVILLSSNINWFVPVGTFASCTLVLSTAYIAYFAIRPLLKFFQLT